MDVTIGPMQSGDWPAVRDIFEQGIATGQATFETETPDWTAWDAGHLAAPRLVARDPRDVLGWAALSPFSRRRCYAGVAEVSIYVAAALRGHGVGGRLLDALITGAEARGVWSLQAVVFPENAVSVALHEHRGFRVVGRRVRIAQDHGVWRDTLLLERRSPTVGTSPSP